MLVCECMIVIGKRNLTDMIILTIQRWGVTLNCPDRPAWPWAHLAAEKQWRRESKSCLQGLEGSRVRSTRPSAWAAEEGDRNQRATRKQTSLWDFQEEKQPCQCMILVSWNSVTLTVYRNVNLCLLLLWTSTSGAMLQLWEKDNLDACNSKEVVVGSTSV